MLGNIGSVEQEAGFVTLRSLRYLDREVSRIDQTYGRLLKNGNLTIDHALLQHLDYASSGHTGFASTAQLALKANASVTLTAGAGMTGGGDLSANRTFDVATVAGSGIAVAADSISVDQSSGFTPTWAGVHTYSATDVHNAGVSLGTSGVLKAAVANGASNAGLDLQDGAGAGVRTTGYTLMVERPSDSVQIMAATWDGRFGFGYSSGLGAGISAGHRLSFTDDDASSSPSGAPVYVGILAYEKHSSATQSPSTGPFGSVGVSVVSTTTGLSANLQAGLVGAVVGAADTAMAGKIYAGVIGLAGRDSLGSYEPTAKDQAFGKNTHFKGGVDHITGFWSQVMNMTSATGYMTNFPGLVSSARLCIQDYGAPSTNAASTTEYWAIYGENVNGSVASFPNVTGYVRMTYPRRTGRTGIRAMHAWWEPWPNTTTIRGGAAKGDTYFDDGTNFRIGLWEFDGATWLKLHQLVGSNALGGGAAATLGTIGGTGPATAAQAGWAKHYDETGTAYWTAKWV